MAEKQTFAEYHFKPEDVVKALRDAGYDVPEPIGGAPKFSIGSRESDVAVVLRYGDPIAYDTLKPRFQIGTDLSVVIGDDLSQPPNT